MELGVIIALIGVPSAVLGGAVREISGWALHRDTDRARKVESETHAELDRLEQVASRADINDRLRDRLDRQDQTIEELRTTADELRVTIEQLRQSLSDQAAQHRKELDTRDAAHRQDILVRDQLNGSQQLVLAQQAEEIKGLKTQVATMSHSIEQWQIAATEGRAGLREALLSAVAPPSPPTPSGGAE